MISRFFIDRPIFATVLSFVVVILGGVAFFRLPVAQYPEVVPPTIQVSATYPGANAKTISETVAAPIEQEINGVENLLYIGSRSTNDGRLSIDVTFKIGTDLDMAQVLVQNRVAAAMAKLPEPVKRQGVITRKRSPSILLCVNLVSDMEGESKKPVYDLLFMSNYATTRIKDQLARIPGVGDVQLLGARDFSMRIWLDPDKMASRGLMAPDVLSAINEQNIQVAAGSLGQPPAPANQGFALTINTLGRLSSEDEFQKLVIKTDSLGRKVYLADVVRDSIYEVRLDAEKLKAEGLNEQSVREGLKGAGELGPMGSEPGLFTLRTSGSTPWGIRIQPGATENRRNLALRDIIRSANGISLVQGGIELGAQNYNINSYLDGSPSVSMALFQQPGSNAVSTAHQIRNTMLKLKDQFPPGMRFEIVYDTTVFIEQSVDVVYHTLFEAVILVLIVVLLFLQDWKITILPMIEVPVSLIGTFGIMSLLGFSLNNLSLFGLVLAIGIVVDDAIVVIENVERWIAKGYEPKEAARRAMDETTGAVLAIAVVLSAVFIPTAMLTGISGQFFRQFALTIAASTIISALNALSMTPARCALVMKPHGQANQSEPLPKWVVMILFGWLVYRILGPFLDPLFPDAVSGNLRTIGLALPGVLLGFVCAVPFNKMVRLIYKAFDNLIGASTNFYTALTRQLVRRALIMVVLYVGLIGFTGYAFTHTPTGFIPEQDKGYLVVAAQLPEGAALGRTDEVMRRLDMQIRKDPAVSHTLLLPGYSILTSSNINEAGGAFVILKPFEERINDPELGQEATLNRLAKIMDAELDAVGMAFGAPAVDGLGSAGGFKIQIQDRTAQGLSMLADSLQAMQSGGMKKNEFGSLFSTFSNRQPQIYLDIDRVKAKTQHVTLNSVFDTLQTYLGGAYVNDITLDNRNWQVNVQADARFRLKPDNLRSLFVRNTNGKMVPLGTLISIREDSGPAIVNRFMLFPAAEMIGSPREGFSSGQAMAAVEALAKDSLPNGMGYEWTELSLLERQAGEDPLNMAIFPLGVLFVFLALAAQYESWSMPAAILLIIPMCLLSAWVGMAIGGLDNNLFVQIGLVVLVGLAAKNAILIVEFAKQREDEGLDKVEAVIDAAKSRFRPILMTSFAFILGVLPLVFSSGAGAEMRKTIGITVFSGMIGVTIFGLLFTPVFYVVIRWLAGDRPKTVGVSLGISEDASSSGKTPHTLPPHEG